MLAIGRKYELRVDVGKSHDKRQTEIPFQWSELKIILIYTWVVATERNGMDNC